MNTASELRAELEALAKQKGLEVRFTQQKLNKAPWVKSRVYFFPEGADVRNAANDMVLSGWEWVGYQDKGERKYTARYRIYSLAWYWLSNYKV